MNARPATKEDLALFRSLRGADLPPDSFVGDGPKVVRRMLSAHVASRILCSEKWLPELEARPELAAGGDAVDVMVAAPGELDDLVGYRLHLAIMALGRIPPECPLTGTLHVALDGLSNTENVGAILRTCAAFGVDGVIVGPGTASPWHRRAIRVSMGAPLIVPVHAVEDLADFCRGRAAWAAHIHGEKVDFRAPDYRGPTVLVLGAEADGVTPRVLEACRGTIYIPMASDWDCLNVGASAAVLLAEAQRQRTTKAAAC
jgi:tRNA G18 (ribose-2'-O)-methylase SpoU